MSQFRILPVTEEDRTWMKTALQKSWGSSAVVTRGVLHQADQMPGFLALQGDQRVGLLTYRLARDECEIISLNSEIEGVGAGTALIDQLRATAAAAGCCRIWLITTNDNLAALRFYQKRGFTLVAVHRNALAASRRLKPEIPQVGLDGIPLRDEIELELRLRTKDLSKTGE